MIAEITQKTDLGAEFRLVLTAVESLEHRFGMGYVIDFLRGGRAYGLREELHAQLPTYGSLKHRTQDHVRKLVNYLVREGYLQVLEDRYGKLGLSESGYAFLAEGPTIDITAKALAENALDTELRRQLRLLRKQFAQEGNLPPFRVFTDYSLQSLVDLKPLSVEELLRVPGFGHFKANRYGPALLRVIQQLDAQKDTFRREKYLHKATTPSYQAIKTMFHSGLSLEEMAGRRNIQVGTVRSALLCLHAAGEVDLKPWIERNLPEQDFRTGITYFAENENPLLRDAYEQLGLDYDTLRLCRLYISDKKQTSFTLDSSDLEQPRQASQAA